MFCDIVTTFKTYLAPLLASIATSSLIIDCFTTIFSYKSSLWMPLWDSIFILMFSECQSVSELYLRKLSLIIVIICYWIRSFKSYNKFEHTNTTTSSLTIAANNTKCIELSSRVGPDQGGSNGEYFFLSRKCTTIFYFFIFFGN